MSESYDAIIVGGGVQGASAAYHLSAAGLGKVLVLESLEAPGRGSSGRSGSMLMKSRENAVKIALSRYSYDWLMRFDEFFGEPLKFSRTGFLSLVPENLRDRYLEEHSLRVAGGVPSELLEVADIRRLAPAVGLDGVAFGVLGPDDGVIDPNQLVRGYVREAMLRGAQLRTNEHVLEINTSGGRVVGVTTTATAYASPIVVNAAGAGAVELARGLGVQLPISNLRRSLYFVAVDDPRLQIGPMVEDAGLEWYYRGLGGDRVLLGMGLESDGTVSDEPDLDFWTLVKEAATERLPAIARARVVGGTSGVRPITPDILPFVGPVAEVDGFYVSCGWGGEGIMHSPAGGRMLADSITGTETPGLDWRRCSPSRLPAPHAHPSPSSTKQGETK